MKNNNLRFGSVCSGIEAASLAWEPLGLVPAWFSEIEPFPCAVLAHRWPHVPNHGDMTALEARILAGEVEAPDVLVGGTPCQAFSVAGLRGGLSDARGNLTLCFVRIKNAIDTVRHDAGLPPCIVVWENVPGVLSSKDNAFGHFLAGLAGAGVPLEPAGGRWTNSGLVRSPAAETAWRILDAQYFGVPQRRRRVFLVSGSRDLAAAEILFERESGGGDSEQGEAARQNPACFPESSFGTYRQDHIAGTVKASGGACQGGSETLVIDGAVRRLTPTEAERLQGMPGGHTAIPWRGKPAADCPDGQRYKAVGNSMAVPVVRWIGQRILQRLENIERETNGKYSE